MTLALPIIDIYRFLFVAICYIISDNYLSNCCFRPSATGTALAEKGKSGCIPYERLKCVEQKYNVRYRAKRIVASEFCQL